MFYSFEHKNIIMTLFIVFFIALFTFIGINFSNDKLTANAESGTSGLKYTKSDDSTYYIVSGYSGKTTDVIIPDTYKSLPVKIIGNEAFFDNDTITSVTIPDSVTEIQDGYVSNAVTLSGTLKTTYGAFSGCVNLEEVIIGSGVTSVGANAFYWCSSLQSVTIPDSVTTIGNSAFENCTSLTNVNMSNSVTSIGNSAFMQCTSLTSVTIPDSVTYIETHAFDTYGALISVTFENADGWYVTTTSGATSGIDLSTSDLVNTSTAATYLISTYRTYYWNRKESLKYTLSSDGTYYIVSGIGTYNSSSLIIPDTHNCKPVKEIGKQAFLNNTNITSVTISDSITTINYGAFSGCSSLTNVTIGSGVNYIDEFAFSNCSSLTSVTFSNTDGWYITYYERELVIVGEDPDSGSLYELQYVEHTTYLSSSDLSNTSTAATYLKSTYTDGYKWYNASLAYTLSDDGTYYIVSGIGTYTSKDVIIPDTYAGLPVKAIADSAFSGNTTITSVTIGGNVTSIGFNAFHECSNITSVTFGSSVTHIWGGAFVRCTGLTSITIPDNVTYIGQNAFLQCRNLASVTLGNGVTEIVETAFRECDALTSIVIPDSVTSVGANAFMYCTSLTSVTIGSGLTYLSYGMFEGCTSLTEITIPSNIKSIGLKAFYECGFRFVWTIIKSSVFIVFRQIYR